MLLKWDEGIALLRVGDKARFVIPSHLGYGSRGAGEQFHQTPL
jgi:peptidyl-prolyl cis-trans isomerase A (cyclophilin A)